MNIFGLLWVEIIKRPIFNLLVLFLSLFGGSLGWAIIVLTFGVRLLLIKNAMGGMKMQDQMTDLQPKMKEIQEKYEDDPQKMSSEMMNLLKSSGGGPLKGCLGMLLQIPVFLGIFYTVKDFAQQEVTTQMYSFLHSFTFQLEHVDTMFYGIDLLANNNILLTILAGVFMYTQMTLMRTLKGSSGKSSSPNIPGMDNENMPDMGKMMKFMNVFFVAMMAGFVWTMPSAIGLYILTTTFFGSIQQLYQYRTVVMARIRAALK